MGAVCSSAVTRWWGKQAGKIKMLLQDAVSSALDHAPTLIILDDLDAIISSESEGPEHSTAFVALAEFLGDLIDHYQVP